MAATWVQGGGGNAPPRFFSAELWGTIIYPDEIRALPPAIRTRILTASPFCASVNSGLAWDRWSANKHLVFVLATTLTQMASQPSARANANAAIARLRQSVSLHQQIEQAGVFLADNTNTYQENWRLGMEDLLRDRSDDFDYLELL